jgi:hypothetical protein
MKTRTNPWAASTLMNQHFHGRLLRNMNVVVLLILVLLPWRAEATIWWDESFESATVPLDPSKIATDQDSIMRYGVQGAPPGWILWRQAFHGLPFNGGYAPDQCFFTTEQAHSGTKAVKIQYTVLNPNEPGNTASYTDCSVCKGTDCGTPWQGGIPYATEFYWRAWVRLHNYGLNPYKNFNAQKVIYFHTFSASGYPDALFMFLGSLVPAMTVQNAVECPNFNNTLGNFVANCNTTSNLYANQGLADLTQDTWHCLEGHYKMNSMTGTTPNRDAVFEQWINGNLALRYTNWAFRSNVDNRFLGFQIYKQGAALGSVMYWDDVAAGDERIGCGVVPTPAVKPSAPLNLQTTFWKYLLDLVGLVMPHWRHA